MTAKTISDGIKKDNQELAHSKLVSQAKSLISSFSWLSPCSLLEDTASSKFGRSIEHSLNELCQRNGIISLRLRKQQKAVVMSIQNYERVLEMKENYERLLEIESERVISNALNDFDALYDRITSSKSLEAADSLFSASADDLRKTYRPGETESS